MSGPVGPAGTASGEASDAAPPAMAPAMTPVMAPVLILGAGSDIGRALGRLWAASGRALILAGRDAAGLARDAADLSLRHGVSARAVAWDARDIAGAPAWFDALSAMPEAREAPAMTEARRMPAAPQAPAMPEVVVCLVGAMDPEAARDPLRLADLVAVNFTGPAAMLAVAADRLAALSARTGRATAVVGVGSVAGDRGRAANWPYGASKAGLAAALSGLRQEHARSGCLVITVRPGRVATRMTEGVAGPAALTLSAEAQARAILRAVERRRPVVVDWRWRLVMGVIGAIPERVFMRLRF